MKPQPAPQPSTRPARPVTHIQSPAPQRVRGRREGKGRSFTRPARPHPVTRPATGIQTTLLEGFILCWRLCPEEGTGEGGGGAGRLQASAPSRLCTQREGGRRGCLGGLGVYRHLTPTTEPQLLGRSAAHRRDYPSIGCLECITTTFTGIGWTGGRGREAARCGRDTTFETTNTSSSGPATH